VEDTAPLEAQLDTKVLQSLAPENAGGKEKQKQREEKLMAKQAMILSVGQLSALTGRMRGPGKRRGKLEEFRVRLPIEYQVTTTANTTYTQPIVLTPSDSGEWTALAALYDEIIVDSGDVKFSVVQTAAGGTLTPNLWVLAYDPISSAALGSLANGVQHSQHFVWGMSTAGAASVNLLSVPTCVTKNGLFDFRWRTPKGTARLAATPAQFGHDWSSTGETGDIYGYLKPHFKAMGGSTVFVWSAIVTLHCRVRSRS
jgi:hypothetical protein